MRLIILFTTLLLVGCSTTGSPRKTEAARPVMVARHTNTPIIIDGKLDEAVWRTAHAYPYHLADDRDPEKKDAVQEAGEVRLAWDEANLYVAVRFVDSDVVTRGEKRNELHFLKGDTAEVFLKPLTNTIYWELYDTPHSQTSTFCFPSLERRQEPGSFQYKMDIQVAGAVDGTLNDSTNTDRQWTGEMAIPRKELERWGDAFPGYGWTIFAARYNYSKNLINEGQELTMTPRLQKTNFHDHSGYALLKLKP